MQAKQTQIEYTADKKKLRDIALYIASNGLVNREGGKFVVEDEAESNSIVRRNESGKILCDCVDFAELEPKQKGFRCKHILAVKFALAQKATEKATKLVSQTVTESDSSKSGGQKTNKIHFRDRQTDTPKLLKMNPVPLRKREEK